MGYPRQLYLDVKLDEAVCLDNFISCSSTHLTLKALNNFLEDGAMITSLFLWGLSGTGKHYLLEAVNRCIDALKKTGFISFSKPIIDPLEATQGFDFLDVIFIQDLHLMPQTKDWERAIFNLINTSLLNGIKMFISSGKVVMDLEIELPDLRSRLLAFTAVEIPEISDNEKASALSEFSERKGLSIDERTIDYILTHTSRSLTDLMNLITELDGFSLEKKRNLTIPLVRELLLNK